MKDMTSYLETVGLQQVERHELGYRVAFNHDLQPEAWSLAWHFSSGTIRVRALEEGSGLSSFTFARSREIEEKANELLRRAMELRASDIHLEPSSQLLRVRLRIDGHLITHTEIGKEHKDALISHLKLRAGMDIAEKRRPQDGRIAFPYQAKNVDLRASTLLTQYGEKLVLRVLDKSGMNLDLNSLGFSLRDLRVIRESIQSPYGFCLVTGPTGSGKTTTLYSCLETLKSESLNILTIEDPIEYRLEGINQTQVKPEIGLNFSAALKTFLRQDPNVIMIGEIRDKETAEMSLRASLTGHLVFSTLHTNDACSTVPRLLDMGIQGTLLADSLSLVVAQRLSRKLCPHCKTPLDREEILDLAWPGKEEWLAGEPGQLFQANGCSECAHIGYRGRLGLFEVVGVNEAFRSAIIERSSVDVLRKIAMRAGTKPLSRNALEAVYQGHTSLDEVRREVIL